MEYLWVKFECYRTQSLINCNFLSVVLFDINARRVIIEELYSK